MTPEILDHPEHSLTWAFLSHQEKRGTLLYFSASGMESLSLDPLCQPAQFAFEAGLNVLSCNLPFHPDGADKIQAIAFWREAFEKGEDFLTPFLGQVKDDLEILHAEGVIDHNQLLPAGLSRGAVPALHLLSLDARFKAGLLFAPLTDFHHSTSFKDGAAPLYDSLSPFTLIPSLVKKKIRIYMGNHDLMVDTDSCYNFVRRLVQKNADKGVRSPPVELILSPSIGRLGHGTDKQQFLEGARWAAKQLKEEE